MVYVPIEQKLGREFRRSGCLDLAFALHCVSDAKDNELTAAWKACSSVENAKAGVRRHVMTYREDCMTPKGATPYRPLPVAIDGEKTMTLQTGDCAGAKTTLYLGVSPESKLAEVIVDGKKAVCKGKAQDSYMQNPKRDCDEDRDMAKMLRDSEYYAYEFTAGKGNVREIVVTGNGTLKYLEIKIEE